jgi:hypothetical protein
MRMSGHQAAAVPGVGAALAALREVHEAVVRAVARVGEIGPGSGREDRRHLLVEAREQLVAALHLVDGVGVALRRELG